MPCGKAYYATASPKIEDFILLQIAKRWHAGQCGVPDDQGYEAIGWQPKIGSCQFHYDLDGKTACISLHVFALLATSGSAAARSVLNESQSRRQN